MKNKLIAGIIIFFIILFGYCITAKAAISVTNKQVNSEEQFSINVTSDISLISYTVTANSDSGLTFVNSSGGAGAGTKSISNALTTGSTKELATFTFKAPKVDNDTQYKITFKASGMGKEDFSKVDDDTKTVTITVKAPIVEKTEPPKVEETPNFTDANKKMYAENDMNLRASWSTESKGTKIAKGTELTVTATSNNTVNKYVWYRVTYKGKTFYAASNLLTNTKPEEPVEEPKTEEPKEETPVDEPTTIDTTNDGAEAKDGLKSLEIEGITLSPKFSPDIYEYRIILKQDINELTINAVPVLEDATVTIAGNTNLKEGENLITIVVYNAENEVATYQITANKNTLDLSITDNLLKSGTQLAKRNLIIFIAILVVAIIALVVIMILKRKNNEEQYEDDFEEGYGRNDGEGLEFTENEQTVENTEVKSIQNETTDDEIVEQIETRRPRREKRKGKHF